MQDTNYVIKITRSFYGPSTKSSLEMSEGCQRAQRFTSPAAARARIAAMESGVYHTGHNESGAPTYSVVRADRLPQYLAYAL